MRVAVAAVPYFPRRRVGSWHDSYLRCWNTAGATCGCAVAQVPLCACVALACRNRIGARRYPDTVVTGVRDEGCPGLIEAIIEKSDG